MTEEFSRPRITIVVPVYKVEQYLARCINSILAQTYKNLEIILVDDGSPDKCGEICDRYAELDDRVRVVHQQNQGLSAARNVGIDMATGEYISFVDSDDYIESQMIEILYDNLCTYQAQISSCEFVAVRESKEVPKPRLQNVVCELTSEQALSKYLLSTTVDLVAWNKLYDIRLFSDIRFPVGKLYEDHFTTYRLLDLARKIVHTRAQLYYYYLRSTGISRLPFSSRTLQIKEGVDEECAYIREKYPSIKKNIDLAYLRWITQMYDIMVLADRVDISLQSEIRELIRVMFFDILQCSYFGMIRMMQFYLLMISPSLYKKAYLLYMRKNR